MQLNDAPVCCHAIMWQCTHEGHWAVIPVPDLPLCNFRYHLIYAVMPKCAIAHMKAKGCSSRGETVIMLTCVN